MPRRLALTLLAALIVVGAVAIASIRSHPRVRQTVVVAYPSAPGLRVGAPVTYLGVEAGTVEDIDLSSGHVVATLGIRRSDVVLRVHDTARLRTIGLLGDRVVDVTPGPHGAPTLGGGDTLVGVAPPEPTELSGPAADSLARRVLRSLGDSMGRRTAPPAAPGTRP